MGDLNRIKREMRSWAKTYSTKDIPVSIYMEIGSAELFECLSHVVIIENGQLPRGLSTPKSSGMLLNALLAHDIYTSLFRNPFVFLDGITYGENATVPGVDMIEQIYHAAKRSNRRDAHLWRSQTLRLLLPPIQDDSRAGEKKIHNVTEKSISNVAEQYATNFLAGQASHFVDKDANPDYIDKVKSIYREAATITYKLWTRRTFMRCYTLQGFNAPAFNINDPEMSPHPSVRYDDHEDQLKGKPITVIVHPLLLVFGTDEAEDYDKSRVWIPAEVWLDSKLEDAD
ncbi:hypothetical protein F5884DRAFT_796458, partial [Xylogone sp. PMI_703]